MANPATDDSANAGLPGIDLWAPSLRRVAPALGGHRQQCSTVDQRVMLDTHSKYLVVGKDEQDGSVAGKDERDRR